MGFYIAHKQKIGAGMGGRQGVILVKALSVKSIMDDMNFFAVIVDIANKLIFSKVGWTYYGLGFVLNCLKHDFCI